MDEKRITQNILSERMSISQPSLSSLISRNNPDLPNIEKYANAFGIEPWELFISREDMQKEIDRRKSLLSHETEQENIYENSSNKEVYTEDIFTSQSNEPVNNGAVTITIEQS